MKAYIKAFQALAAAVMLMLIHACASMGSPSGGPRDEEPPHFVRANPAPGAVGVTPKQITIEFDELVNVKDAFTKVVVSPTSSQTPRISSQGRKVIVQLPDSLGENTTYTIDFGNSIEDNNESNKLEGFSYSFSTGPAVDSLRIAGIVLDPRTLEPQKQTVVGVHSLTADSIFKTRRLERVAKTDDRGRFIIRGLAPGNYRVYALGDVNNDYRWDNPEELIGFYDTMVTPTTEATEVQDTIWNLKTATVDTVVARTRTRFLPNDILLPLFAIDYKPQYVVNYSRVDSTQLKVILNAKTPQPARMKMTTAPGYPDFYRLERSAGNDTLTYWLTPNDLVRTDTLPLAFTYQLVSPTYAVDAKTDTLQFITQRPRVPAKKEKEKKKKNKEELTDSVAPPTPHIELKMVTTTSGAEVYMPVIFEFQTPLDTLFADRFHLEQKADTVWKPLPDAPPPTPVDSMQIRRYKIEYPWKYGETYRLTVDTLAATGIYGLTPKPFQTEIKIKREEDYSHLRMLISGADPDAHYIAELLNSSDQPVRAVPVSGNAAIFTDISPGTYYVRLYEDANGNGRYDTGNYELWLQPETTWYYPKKINLKKNWEITQNWDINSVAVDLQKPDAIKKNKPERRKGERNGNNRGSGEEEEEEEEEFF